ncbi:hypothetical protein [Streptomyces sp. NPDC002573]|uniref:hypothetical protein n=1 Tax=Streptomyces sp. NPDC002573 TaxID=3364651 RepID=UPI0036C5E934
MLTTLGAKAPKKGYRVRNTPTTKPVNEPAETTDEKHLTKTIAVPSPDPHSGWDLGQAHRGDPDEWPVNASSRRPCWRSRTTSSVPV